MDPSRTLLWGPTGVQGPPLLTLDDVARRLAVTVGVVEGLVKDGSLRVRRIGPELRVFPEDLRDFLRRAEG